MGFVTFERPWTLTSGQQNPISYSSQLWGKFNQNQCDILCVILLADKPLWPLWIVIFQAHPYGLAIRFWARSTLWALRYGPWTVPELFLWMHCPIVPLGGMLGLPGCAGSDGLCQVASTWVPELGVSQQNFALQREAISVTRFCCQWCFCHHGGGVLG